MAPRALWLWLLASCGRGWAWRTAGVLPEAPTFAVYAGKFCFDYNATANSEAGIFEVAVQGQVLPATVAPPGQLQTVSDECFGPCETHGNIYLAVYDDESDHWASVQSRWFSASCEELLHYTSFNISLSELSGAMNRTVYVRERSQPRFWYFAFVACGVTIAKPISYEIHAVNMQQGVQSEFSMDELGSLRLHFLAALFFLLNAWALRTVAKHATGAEALRSRPLLRLLLLSALCSAAGEACLSFHYSVYMMDGWGVGAFEIMGQVWICVAKASLTLLQLLTAKGWALFYAPAELMQRRMVFCMIGGSILATIACEIHADFFNDWSTALYLYQSWAGQIILLLNVALFVEAWRSMRDTYRHERSTEVRIFYAMISLASLLYFLTLPVLCVAASSIASYDRVKYIQRAEVATRFMATAMLSFCLRPTRLDAMVNARLEAGLDTVGEMRDDVEEPDDDDDDVEDDAGGYREASEDVPERFSKRLGGVGRLGVRDELPAE